MKRLLMIAGGTGGHIFPALAVADALQTKGVEIHWLGSRVGMERQLVGDRYPMNCISVKAIRGQGLRAKLLSPWRLLLATWQAWCIIRRVNPDIVLGMGGFVGGPGGIAARLAKKPLVIHEQNAVAGATNRFFSRSARAILAGFPDAFSSEVKAQVVGNPVRPDISDLSPPRERMRARTGPLRILVLGGSQGARAINQVMQRVFSHYPAPSDLSVWHQTGTLDFDAVQRAYATLPLQATVEPFIRDVVKAYAWADFVICRAGALTVSEIAAAGIASLLIPYPYAADDHQFHNASYLVKVGAAEVWRQEQLTDGYLSDYLQALVHDRARLVQMAEQARQQARPEALSSIVALCQNIMESEGGAHGPVESQHD